MDDAQWEAFREFRAACRKRDLPGVEEPRITSHELRQRMTEVLAAMKSREHVLFRSNGKAVGSLRLVPNSEDLSVAWDYWGDPIPDKFMRIVAQAMLSALEQQGFVRAFCMSSNPRHAAANRRLSPTFELSLYDMSVRMDAVNAPLLQEWKVAFHAENPDLRIAFHDGYAPEIRADFIRLNAKFQQDLPTGGDPIQAADLSPEVLDRVEKANQASGTVSNLAFLLDPAGHPVGFSEVNANTFHKRLTQNMTGVLPDYRGRGLSKALKAAMYFHLRDRYPDIPVITTNTSPHNQAMLHINRSMGFQVLRESTQFTFAADGVRRFLEKVGR